MQGIWFDLILSTFGRWIRMRPYLNNFPNMIPIDLFVNKQVDTNWSRSSIDYPLRIEWQDRGIYSTHSLKCSRAHRGKSPRTKISWLCSARAQIFNQIPAPHVCRCAPTRARGNLWCRQHTKSHRGNFPLFCKPFHKPSPEASWPVSYSVQDLIAPTEIRILRPYIF